MLVPQTVDPAYPGGHIGFRSLQASNSFTNSRNSNYDSGWIPIRGGELFVGLLQLMTQRPTPAELVEGGWEGEVSAPLYIARVVTEDGCYPGECGSHFSGARIPRDGNVETGVPTYEVLGGTPGSYTWKPVTDAFELSKIDDMKPVLGGHQSLSEDSELRLLYVARSLTMDGKVHLGHVSIGNEASICYEGNLMTAKYYEVLVHNNSNSNAVRALVGKYATDGHYTRTKEAERYSELINFPSPWEIIPRIALGLTSLDIGSRWGTPIRVEVFTKKITKENFICNARSWGDGILHNTDVYWIAVNQPNWQCGVFNSQDAKSADEYDTSSEHRVHFAERFEDAPPVVFVCFSGLHITNKWNVRVYATNIDQTGFTIAIVNCGEEGTWGPAVKMISAAITWIAIPARDVSKKKNVWVGSFATGRRAHGFEECGGHVDFGFTFKRTPKIFTGLRQFSANKDRNLRLRMTTSNVTTQGMDWKISKWHDTILYSGGANFIAVDVE
ncbi:hypothetical protein MD484_g7834, partial [Candolleomyces efflorescens]